MTRLGYLLPTLLPISLLACGDNIHVGAGVDAAPPDDAVDAPASPFETLATFDPALGQLPEGVVVTADGPFVGLAPLGQVVKVNADTTVDVYAQLPGVVANTFTLGLAANPAGEIFVGVGASGPTPVPPPGVYKIPAGGGTPTLFATQLTMKFPNGLDLDGTDLYVSDSGAGRIFKVTSAGAVTIWSQNAMLAGDQTACGGSGAGFNIGTNGIAHDATNRYVAVTDFGRILRIPINANGSAGTPVVIAESCADLAGADGLALDADGSLIIARNGPSLKLVRVATDGTITTLAEGAPLDGPASVVLDAPGHVVITNSAFFSGPTGHPSLLGLTL